MTTRELAHIYKQTNKHILCAGADVLLTEGHAARTHARTRALRTDTHKPHTDTHTAHRYTHRTQKHTRCTQAHTRTGACRLSRLHDCHGPTDAFSATPLASSRGKQSSASRRGSARAPGAAADGAGSGGHDESGGSSGEGGGGTTERRTSFPPQLPPLPLSARSLRSGVDGLPVRSSGQCALSRVE